MFQETRHLPRHTDTQTHRHTHTHTHTHAHAHKHHYQTKCVYVWHYSDHAITVDVTLFVQSISPSVIFSIPQHREWPDLTEPTESSLFQLPSLFLSFSFISSFLFLFSLSFIFITFIILFCFLLYSVSVFSVFPESFLNHRITKCNMYLNVCFDLKHVKKTTTTEAVRHFF